MHILRLTHSVDAIRRLSLLRRIPPTPIVDDVICLSQVKSYTSNIWRKNYCIKSPGHTQRRKFEAGLKLRYANGTESSAVAVRALCEIGFDGREYVLTGPESLTQREQVAAIGAVLGRTLRFDELRPEVARRELEKIMPEAIVKMMLAAWSGAVGRPAMVTTAVADVTGAPPRTFREWVKDNVEEFRARPLVLS